MLGVVAVTDPARGRLLPPCPVHAVTGLWCPGCGSARALHELTGGHVGAAFGLNPVLVLALPFVLYAWAAWALPALDLPAPRPRAMPVWAVRVAVGTVLLFGVLRNVPIAPLSLLAP